MKSNTHRLHHAGLLILAFFATALSLSASVTLGPLFRDGVVLQQGRPVTVWGQADVGEKVHVSFGRQSLETETDAQGHWQVQLAPLAANAQPAELVVQGTNTLRVNDVLVGEVWLCSGQSNMAWTFPQLHLPPPSAPEINDPLLRVFKVPNVTSETPLDTAPGSWEPTSETNAAKLSAVAYYFGRQLRDQLNVPVGLINSSWGGSQIESWMSTPTIAALPMGKLIEDRWTKLLANSPAAFEKYQIDLAKWEADKAAAVANNTEFKSRKPRRPVGKGDPVQPASIYNAMLYPLTPATIRGVIWYQGESNDTRYTEYRTLFPAMITQWRSDFKQPDLPFYYVQLPNMERPENTGRLWGFHREAQNTALKLPHTGVAVTIDIGEAHNIHPQNKRDVGHRLAALALAEVYQREIPAYGPRFERLESMGNALRVHFTHADGLVAGDADVSAFEIAGEDHIFHKAEAHIDADTVIVSSEAVSHPIAVRYAFTNNPAVSLRNADGLPAEPFRSDNW